MCHLTEDPKGYRKYDKHVYTLLNQRVGPLHKDVSLEAERASCECPKWAKPAISPIHSKKRRFCSIKGQLNAIKSIIIETFSKP